MGRSGWRIGRAGAIKGQGRSNEEHVKAGIYARPKKNEEDEMGARAKMKKRKKERKKPKGGKKKKENSHVLKRGQI